MKDGAMFVGQQDGAPKCIEGLGHAHALDGADIEHVADCHCPAQVRQ
jgi:hypothetical protein